MRRFRHFMLEFGAFLHYITNPSCPICRQLHESAIHNSSTASICLKTGLIDIHPFTISVGAVVTKEEQYLLVKHNYSANRDCLSVSQDRRLLFPYPLR
jgi:hypothetical protein